MVLACMHALPDSIVTEIKMFHTGCHSGFTPIDATLIIIENIGWLEAISEPDVSATHP